MQGLLYEMAIIFNKMQVAGGYAGCPPTLLIHGADDAIAPVKATRRLCRRLVVKKVPVVMHVIPQADHAFDLAFPKIALAAHNAIYDVERFMALMNGSRYEKEKESLVADVSNG